MEAKMRSNNKKSLKELLIDEWTGKNQYMKNLHPSTRKVMQQKITKV
jgi:hypothetical protein